MSYDPRLGRPGDFFFHYTTRVAAFEHILPTRQLRLSPAFRMRDPLESNPGLISAAWLVADDLHAQREAEETVMHASIELRQLRRCSKVLCLTVDAADYVGDAEIFGRGYARARMWEQYAENHAGICLMFRRREFEVMALQQLRSRSTDSWAHEVAYTHRGILDEAAATVFLPSDLAWPDLSRDHVRKHLKSIFFTKLTDWQSEHEFRFVESSMDETHTFVDYGNTLVGVILGWRFPEWQTPGAFMLCDQLGAEPWRMSWDRSRPSPQWITSVRE